MTSLLPSLSYPRALLWVTGQVLEGEAVVRHGGTAAAGAVKRCHWQRGGWLKHVETL